jgi:Mn-containing catalase
MSEKIKEYTYISNTLGENLSKGQDASERRISLDYYTENFISHYKSVMELTTAEEISKLFEGAKSEIMKKLLGNKQDYYDTESYFKSADSRLKTAVSGIPIRQQSASTGQFGEVRINLIIDLRNNIKAQNGGGYARWAKLFTLKQAAQTLAYLEENDLASYERLYDAADDAQKEFTAIRTEIASAEQRLKDNAATQKHLRQFARTREVYAAYKQSGYSKTFRSAHERDISQHQEAKKFFDGQGFAKSNKLPNISELKKEYAETLAKKKSLYPRYSELKERTANVITAKKNIDIYLGIRAQDAYLRDNTRHVDSAAADIHR